MLPVYVSYFAAGRQSGRRTVTNALGFVCGFTAVFVLLGAFAGAVGTLLRRWQTPLNIITGCIVIVFGLSYLGVIRIGFLQGKGGKADTRSLGFFSSMLLGTVFSVGWTPCVGAFLGSALMMASSQGGTAQGVLMLLVYSLGLGVPFIVSAILIDRLKGAFNFIKRNYKAVNIVSGSLLIAVGILMATGLMGRFLSLLTL